MFSRLVHYDSYERHKAVDILLGKASCNLILDVGGLAGSLANFVRAQVIALNVDTSGDVEYGGKSLPFGSRTFDAVVSLDTLEHLPQEFRKRFVVECTRVARRFVLIAAPLGTSAHLAYEDRLDRLYYEVCGTFNRWLHEHVIYGLPTEVELIELKQSVSDQGFSVKMLYAGDYEWQCRNFERSLLLRQSCRPLRKLSGLFNLVISLAPWRKITFSENPYDVANRFYLLGQRIQTDCIRDGFDE
jgi:hypothetical protein